MYHVYILEISGPPVYYEVKGDLWAFGECTMYRCGGPHDRASGGSYKYKGVSESRWTTVYRGTSGPLVNVPSIDVGNLRAPLSTSKYKGHLRAPGLLPLIGDLTAPGECTMYRYRGPHGPRSTTMYRGTSWALLNIPCVYVGDLKALGLLLCIGEPQGSLSIMHFKYLDSRHIHKETKLQKAMNWMEWNFGKTDLILIRRHTFKCNTFSSVDFEAFLSPPMYLCDIHNFNKRVFRKGWLSFMS